MIYISKYNYDIYISNPICASGLIKTALIRRESFGATGETRTRNGGVGGPCFIRLDYGCTARINKYGAYVIRKPRLNLCTQKLFFRYYADRTTFRTRSAAYAGIRVDNVFIVAFTYRTDRTTRRACAALDTTIIDFVSHNDISFMLM